MESYKISDKLTKNSTLIITRINHTYIPIHS